MSHSNRILTPAPLRQDHPPRPVRKFDNMNDFDHESADDNDDNARTYDVDSIDDSLEHEDLGDNDAKIREYYYEDDVNDNNDDSQICNQLAASQNSSYTPLNPHFSPPFHHDMYCKICTCVLVCTLTTSCGHNYCAPCLAEWFNSRSSRTCPVCRSVVKTTGRNYDFDNIIESAVEAAADDELKRDYHRRKSENQRISATFQSCKVNGFLGTPMVFSFAESASRATEWLSEYGLYIGTATAAAAVAVALTVFRSKNAANQNGE